MNDNIINNNNLKQLREDKGVMQKMIAKQLGISANYYSQIENGHRPLRIEHLLKLRDIFNVSLEKLSINKVKKGGCLMLNIEINEEFSKTLVNDVVEQLVPILLQELKQNELPHLLTRKQFMELVNIGESKCNELFHRRDFPVNRELGHPRVPTKEFFKWLSATNQNANEVNMKFPHQIV